ncbi:unnamed protein product [Kuraishia capsulata CBS 1993]|uniref:Phosphatidylinositol N-acetylglucosaminyltransferase subunit H conserved domain-containing protein n=1 Tax=Kuraishia capsulata CBS 1993 TaxID=1382522 RepID=W6MM38_9ASCO|nr:uncharacterized protein KUCA_T00003583001 [Kuraishia capsulata CBS 1993]CDK27604.1 unnamed protein product [Kuraishia capsulata CBS 1993]
MARAHVLRATVCGPGGTTRYTQSAGDSTLSSVLKGQVSQCNYADFTVTNSEPSDGSLLFYRLGILLCLFAGFSCVFYQISGAPAFEYAIGYVFGPTIRWISDENNTLQALLLCLCFRLFVSITLAYIVTDWVSLKTDMTKSETILILPKVGLQTETRTYRRSFGKLIRQIFGKKYLKPASFEDSKAKAAVGMSLYLSEKKFHPMDRVLDVMINECFSGFNVIFVMQLIHQISDADDYAISVVFPELLPRRELLETVWRCLRECLEK